MYEIVHRQVVAWAFCSASSGLVYAHDACFPLMQVRQVKQREETTRKQLTDHSQRLQTATAECVDAKGESRAATEENGVLKKRIAELEKQLHDLAGDKAVRKGETETWLNNMVFCSKQLECAILHLQ